MRSWKSDLKPRGSRKHKKSRLFVFLRTPLWLKKLMRLPLFWERFAIVVSTLAFLVSTAATVGTWRQVDIMRAQLTSNDRNAINIKIAVALYDACHKIMLGPVNSIRFANSQNGFLFPIVEGQLKEVTTKQRDEYAWALEQTKREIALLIMQASIFATDASLEPILRIDEAVQARLNSAQDVVSDYSTPYLDLKRIIEIGIDCQMATNQVIKNSPNPPSFSEEINRILSREQPLGLQDAGGISQSGDAAKLDNANN